MGYTSINRIEIVRDFTGDSQRRIIARAHCDETGRTFQKAFPYEGDGTTTAAEAVDAALAWCAHKLQTISM